MTEKYEDEKTIPSAPMCVDDYGSSVYRCHWTGVPVKAENVIYSGGYYPGSRLKFISAPGYEAARKQSKKYFDEFEANCNTCIHLERIKRDRDISGFLYGKCKKLENKDIKFHPEDPMFMPCYEPRP